MEVQGTAGVRPASRALLVMLVGGSIMTLAVLTLVILLHAFTRSPALILPAEALAALLAALSVASIADGVYFSWRRYPQHRRAILFVVGITMATLVAHAYVIDAPPGDQLSLCQRDAWDPLREQQGVGHKLAGGAAARGHRPG